MSRELRVFPVPGVPEVGHGDDLAALISARVNLAAGDVVIVAHKVVSKSEGAVRAVADVRPSERAIELAEAQDKDPRVVQVVLDETAELMRAEHGVLICRTHHGFVCANAGVDASNAAGGTLVTLPRDPDASARRLRSALGGRVAVVITDSFGRAWRHGSCDVAIGVAGLTPLDDWRGRNDGVGALLHATMIAVADQTAAAADLVRRKDSREPVVIVRGLAEFAAAGDGACAAELLRGADEDLFP